MLTDLAITGKPAQFGRGVISDVSDKLLDQFVTCVSGRFAGERAAGRRRAGGATGRAGGATGRAGGADHAGH